MPNFAEIGEWGDLPSFTIETFTSHTKALIERPDTRLTDWLTCYRNSPEVRTIVDTLPSKTIGTYLITQARQLNLDDSLTDDAKYFSSAVSGLSTFIRIKAFNETVQEVQKDGALAGYMPQDIDQMLDIFALDVNFEKKVATAQSLRALWRISTPPTEVQSQAYAQLDIFWGSLKKHLTIQSSELDWSDGLFALICGVKPHAIDHLIPPTVDVHHFHNGFAYGRTLLEDFIDFLLPTSIQEYITASPVLNIETLERFLAWIKKDTVKKQLRQFIKTHDYTSLPRLVNHIFDIEYMEKRHLTANELQQLLFTGQGRYQEHVPFDLREIIQNIQEIDPEFTITENQQIHFLNQDIDWEKVNRRRAELLLTYDDISQGLKSGLIQRRFQNQKPNTTQDLLDVMEEIFQQRETKLDTAL